MSLLRLHKDTAFITYNNLLAKSAKITRMSIASDWIIIEFGNNREKVILDTASVGRQSFSQISRQIRAYKVSEFA